ncbi:hypothetical protein CR513_33321, partial [Mucuna pruriens]
MDCAFVFLAPFPNFVLLTTISGISSSETYSSSSSSSSSSGEALKAMPVAVAEGVSSPAPAPSKLEVAPPKWVHKDVLENQSVMTRSRWNLWWWKENGFVVPMPINWQWCAVARKNECTTPSRRGKTHSSTCGRLENARDSPISASSQWLGSDSGFQGVCLALGILPTAAVFLSHYTTRVGQLVGWVLLTPLPNTGLFTSYTASYKSFKSRFVKIKAAEEGHFYVDPRPLPLYWREPSKFKGLVRSQLPLEAKVDLLGLVPNVLIYYVFWLANMLKKQGVDMAELIKKACLTNDARSSGQKAPDTTAAENKSSTSLAKKDSAPVVEKLTALAVSDKEEGKRKAGSETAEETTTKRGKPLHLLSGRPLLSLLLRLCLFKPKAK